jgi:hypothetical protein
MDRPGGWGSNPEVSIVILYTFCISKYLTIITNLNLLDV